MIKYKNIPKSLLKLVKQVIAEFEKNNFETIDFLFQETKAGDIFIYAPKKEEHFAEKYNQDLTDARKEQLDAAFNILIDKLEEQGIITLLINGRLKEGGHLVLLTKDGFEKAQDKVMQLTGNNTTEH
ncbi:MAG: hypothetical protein R3Y43_04195 [Alphaproteobacteria bacterium]